MDSTPGSKMDLYARAAAPFTELLALTTSAKSWTFTMGKERSPGNESWPISGPRIMMTLFTTSRTS